MTGFGQKAAFGMIAALVLFIIVWSICASVENQLAAERQTMLQELRQLPFYSPAAEKIRIELDFHIDDSRLNAVYPERKDLEKQIEEKTAAAVLAQFPEGSYLAALHKKQQEIVLAKIGDKVRFNFRNYETNTIYEVKGILQMKEKNPGGVVVYINGKSYRVKHILPEFRFLFDENAGARRRVELANTFKDDFDRQKQEFTSKTHEKFKAQVFAEAGYILYRDGRWLPPQELLNLETARRQKEFKTARDKQFAEIIQRHMIMGIPLFKIKRENW